MTLSSSNNSHSSPYISLVNMCYQLRHENEELLETVAAKSSQIETCEKEIRILKDRLKEVEEEHRGKSEESLSERMDLGNERLGLMKENMRLESHSRSLETRVRSLEAELESRNEQVEILLNQLQISNRGSTSTTPQSETVDHDTGNGNKENSGPLSVRELNEENDRLRKQLEFLSAFVIKSSSRKRARETIDLDTAPPMSNTRATPEPVLVISEDSSLLRLFERLVGYNIVRSDNTVTLVSESVSVRLRIEQDNQVSLISEEGIDEASLAVLKSFDSVPGLLAKLTLLDLTTRVFHNNNI
jgi:hypothetical protein